MSLGGVSRNAESDGQREDKEPKYHVVCTLPALLPGMP